MEKFHGWFFALFRSIQTWLHSGNFLIKGQTFTAAQHKWTGDWGTVSISTYHNNCNNRPFLLFAKAFLYQFCVIHGQKLKQKVEKSTVKWLVHFTDFKSATQINVIIYINYIHRYNVIIYINYIYRYDVIIYINYIYRYDEHCEISYLI